MVALLKNATVAYSRSSYNSGTGNTSPATPYATIQARVFPNRQNATNFILLPEAAATSEIVVRCDENTDIQEGDIINSIVTLNTGVNWPGISPNPNEILAVTFVNESDPGFPIEYRDAFVKRSRVGGPTNA
jgi:hypothetical protein